MFDLIPCSYELRQTREDLNFERREVAQSPGTRLLLLGLSVHCEGQRSYRAHLGSMSSSGSSSFCYMAPSLGGVVCVCVVTAMLSHMCESHRTVHRNGPEGWPGL